ncbi:antibiotic biosynthesis monooxygenase [Leptothermofonsia sp. ETS-13]|uniref:antibiotic biosynthesis monooxygenase n=1 Tax=Leptothermofonsia sp. ETS-13 TaxID=3035696 RepID=UPI003BA0941E
MPNTQQSSEPITLVISEIVEPHRIQEYEAWTAGINRAAQQWEGFLGVEIIRPRDHDYPEYVIIVKFDAYPHFRNWVASPTYRKWMEKSRDLVSRRSLQQLPSSLELWFTLPKSMQRKMPQPAYHKKVILGVLAVYPLILIANALLGPFLKVFHPLIDLLISVTFVSALLTYPVMPWLTKLLNFWLYPSSTKSHLK